jgi:RNA polymerase sigma-70 factor (ECF subfamily)
MFDDSLVSGAVRAVVWEVRVVLRRFLTGKNSAPGDANEHVPLGTVIPLKRSKLDPESAEWVDALSGEGQEHEGAVERLHALLLRAAHFEVRRRGGSDDLDQLATDAAHDALIAVMAKLDTFRGDSHFTTWAYKFALLEAAVKVRKLGWREREVPLDPEAWSRVPDVQAGPAASVEDAELMAAIRSGIEEALTPHQRLVLVAVTLEDVPIDVLAERLGSNRNAVYKTLHDARRNLRRRLSEQGIEIGNHRTEAAA